MLSTPLLTSSAPPLRRGAEERVIPPDKGGKGGLNALIVLYSVFYVIIYIIFYNHILYIIIIV